jgi:hypothetical protein
MAGSTDIGMLGYKLRDAIAAGLAETSVQSPCIGCSRKMVIYSIFKRRANAPTVYGAVMAKQFPLNGYSEGPHRRIV